MYVHIHFTRVLVFALDFTQDVEIFILLVGGWRVGQVNCFAYVGNWILLRFLFQIFYKKALLVRCFFVFM